MRYSVIHYPENVWSMNQPLRTINFSLLSSEKELIQCLVSRDALHLLCRKWKWFLNYFCKRCVCFASLLHQMKRFFLFLNKNYILNLLWCTCFTSYVSLLKVGLSTQHAGFFSCTDCILASEDCAYVLSHNFLIIFTPNSLWLISTHLQTQIIKWICLCSKHAVFPLFVVV